MSVTTAAILAMAAAVASPVKSIETPDVGFAARMALPMESVTNCLDILKSNTVTPDRFDTPEDADHAGSDSVECFNEGGGVRVQHKDGSTTLFLISTGPTARLSVKSNGINITCDYEDAPNGAVKCAVGPQYARQWGAKATDAFAKAKEVFKGHIAAINDYLAWKQQQSAAPSTLTR